MKHLALTLLLFFISSYSLSQNIYSNYNFNDTIQGQRLQISAGNISYSKFAGFGSQVNVNVEANYLKWKFTPKTLNYFQASIADDYNKTDLSSSNQSFKRNILQASLYGGTSYYFQPNKFFVLGKASVNHFKVTDDNNSSPYENSEGLLHGGIGYGRIFDAQGLQSAQYFSEALLKKGKIKTKLSSKTLLEIDKLIYAYRNGNYYNKHKDDKESILFRDIENVLLRNNEIENRLDAETAVGLYTIFSNSSYKFFYYPRYTGYQIQSELQYQMFGNTDSRNHYLLLSGAYGIPFSEQTSMLFRAFYSMAIGDKTTGNISNFPEYYELYGGPLDENNLSFNNPNLYPLMSYKSIIGAKLNLYHSINSVAGISIRTYYNFFPENKDISLTNDELCGLDATLTYNIFSRLFSSIDVGYRYTKQYYTEGFTTSLRFDYTIF